MTVEPIFHIALRRDWEAAQLVGEYRVSTLGRTLDDEGYLHAAYAGQWPGVLEAFYSDVREPLVLLEVDPALLAVPVVVEQPPDADESFPHVYGPLAVSAVVSVRSL